MGEARAHRDHHLLHHGRRKTQRRVQQGNEQDTVEERGRGEHRSPNGQGSRQLPQSWSDHGQQKQASVRATLHGGSNESFGEQTSAGSKKQGKRPGMEQDSRRKTGARQLPERHSPSRTRQRIQRKAQTTLVKVPRSRQRMFQVRRRRAFHERLQRQRPKLLILPQR